MGRKSVVLTTELQRSLPVCRPASQKRVLVSPPPLARHKALRTSRYNALRTRPSSRDTRRCAHAPPPPSWHNAPRMLSKRLEAFLDVVGVYVPSCMITQMSKTIKEKRSSHLRQSALQDSHPFSSWISVPAFYCPSFIGSWTPLRC